MNCIDCEEHEVQPDPDPTDWFCDDDVKVLCKKKMKYITVACRPYRIRHESETPKWCPKLRRKNGKTPKENNGKLTKL